MSVISTGFLKSYFNISFISDVSLLLLSPLRAYEIEIEKVLKMKFANKTKINGVLYTNNL